MRNADVQVELVALALGSIRDQIIIAAQDALHAERGAGRVLGSAALADNTGPISTRCFT
jgi:hypothetical protein